MKLNNHTESTINAIKMRFDSVVNYHYYVIAVHNLYWMHIIFVGHSIVIVYWYKVRKQEDGYVECTVSIVTLKVGGTGT